MINLSQKTINYETKINDLKKAMKEILTTPINVLHGYENFENLSPTLKEIFMRYNIPKIKIKNYIRRLFSDLRFNSRRTGKPFDLNSNLNTMQLINGKALSSTIYDFIIRIFGINNPKELVNIKQQIILVNLQKPEFVYFLFMMFELRKQLFQLLITLYMTTYKNIARNFSALICLWPGYRAMLNFRENRFVHTPSLRENRENTHSPRINRSELRRERENVMRNVMRRIMQLENENIIQRERELLEAARRHRSADILNEELQNHIFMERNMLESESIGSRVLTLGTRELEPEPILEQIECEIQETENEEEEFEI